MSSPLKVAILDLNNNHPNQGLRCIRELVENFPVDFEWQIFDVRHKHEIPDTSFDIYIGSGGPDSPLENGIGEQAFLALLDELWKLNQSGTGPAKQFLFICHSFQMACRYFDFAQIKERRSKAFGIFPIHKTAQGKTDPLLQQLPDPFYALDFRDWQIVEVDEDKLAAMGGSIILREKIRPHVDLERAVMGVRFSKDWVGVQFHPEADPEGIKAHFEDEEKRKMVVDGHGQDKYDAILDGLNDQNKIPLTYGHLIPTFLHRAVERLQGEETLI